MRLLGADWSQLELQQRAAPDISGLVTMPRLSPVLRVITVLIETIAIVRLLPPLKVHEWSVRTIFR